MIDWLTIIAPMPHHTPLTGGEILSITPEGEMEWKAVRRKAVSGSFSTGLQIRTCTHTADRCSHVEIAGNPVKFFQGHNLWGTDDVFQVVVGLLDYVSRLLGIEVCPVTRNAWESGAVQITRVDVTESFHLETRAQVLAWLRAAEQTAHLPHRGRGQLVKGSTLYFGKNSRRWSLKLYAKGQEIEKKGHGQDSILGLPHARAWADRTLRAELTLRSMELKRMKLDTVAAWMPVDGVPFAVSELLRDKLGDMTMTTQSRLPADVLDTLRPALRTAVMAWESGADLREVLSRPTFYRYRAELLPHGLDIAVVMPKEAVSNVVPLYRVLEAKPVSVPDWAIGTPLLWEPRRSA